MQFLVLLRGLDAPVAPPPMEIGLVKETFEQFAAGSDPRIKAVYPFAAERAGALLIEANSGEEVTQIIGGLPMARLLRAELHAITTVRATLDVLKVAEQRMASMAASGAPRN